MKKSIPWYESAFIERFTPSILGFASFLLIYIDRISICEQFSSGGWRASDLYSAVFGWASIQTGFVFGIYGFVVSKPDGFIKEIEKDLSFERFIIYIKRANFFGFFLTFFTLPMIVVSPKLTSPNSWPFVVAAIWFAVFVWTFCAFLRVAFIFGRIVAVPDRPTKIPG